MDHQFTEIIDLPPLQELMDSLHRMTGIPAAIMAPDGAILLNSGWPAVCELYHKRHPEKPKRCFPREAFSETASCLPVAGGWLESRCQNDLTDYGFPVTINEVPVAMVLVGPFLLQPATPEQLAIGAEATGVTPEKYLELIAEVAIIPQERVGYMLDFYASLVKLLTELALQSARHQDAQRAAERSESRFRDLFTLAADGIAIIGLNGKILEVNPTMCKLLGYPHQEFLAGKLEDYVVSERVDQIPVRIRQVIEEGQSLFETTLQHRADFSIPVEIRGRTIMFDEQRVILGQVRDLTDRKRSETALRESEERFRGIFEDAGVGMALTLRNGRFAQVNPEFCRFLGYSREELLALTVEQVTFPEDRPLTAQLLQQAIAGERSVVNTEKRYLHKNGNTVWGRVTALYELSGEASQPVSVAMVQDITAQKLAQEAVQESEATLKSILLAVPMSVGLVHDRVFSWVNHWMVDELGYSEQDLIGQSARMLYVSDAEFERVGNVKYGQLARQPMGEAQTRFKCKDGHIIDVLLRSVPINPEDLGAGVIFTALNISEITNVGKELREAFDQAETARQQMNAILRSITAGLMVIDLHGQVSMANPATEGLLAQEPAAMIGKPVADVMDHPEFLEKVRLALIGSEERSPIELSLPGRDADRDMILQVKVAAVKELQGGVRGAVAILRDVTREHEINQLKDEFISTAAHELRTPMTSILGYTELMLDKLEGFDVDQLREFLQIVFERSEALSQIISDMLDLSRVQSGRLISLEKFPGDLASLIRQILTSYEYNKAGCEIQLDIQGDPPLLLFDPRKMTQVFDNLLSNAIKFSQRGGKVDISLQVAPEEVTVAVADQGMGMTPSQIERVFDKFYRVDYSNTAISGLGLGMTLVRSIIEGHGGRIWVDSEVGVGTTVYFTLPGIPRDEEV